MRKDIESILQYFNIIESVVRFGEPKNNKSRIIYPCQHCRIELNGTIFNLKNRIKNSGRVLCNACIGSSSWTDERRDANNKFWTEEKRVSQGQVTKEIFLDKNVSQKHRDGCIKSYDEKPQRKLDLSKNMREKWKNTGTRKKYTDGLIEKWKDPDYQKKQSAFRTNEFLAQASTIQRNITSDPQYKIESSVRMKKVWEREGFRESLIPKLVAIWNEPGYREHISQKMRDVWSSPEFRAKYEAIWADPKFIQLMSEFGSKPWKDEGFRHEASRRAADRWLDVTYKNKIVTSVVASWKNPAYRSKRSEQSRLCWTDDDFRSKFAIARSNQSGKQSGLEKITEVLLQSLELKFISQQPVGPYSFDFFLPEENVYIECQGEYWHSLPGRRERDAAKLTYVEKTFPHTRVLYLHEREFLNPLAISSKICSFIQKEIGIKQESEFNFSDIRIQNIGIKESDEFLKSFHYSSCGRRGSIYYGAFLGEELIGVSKFSSVIRKEVATSMGFVPGNVLELDRFCIHPARHQKNFASWFLSRTVANIWKERPGVTRLVSFADQTYGHHGTIYKASNWKLLKSVPPDYHYVSTEGFLVHKKTLYNWAVKMGQKEAEYAILYKYIKIFGREKMKFIIDRRMTKSPLKECGKV